MTRFYSFLFLFLVWSPTTVQAQAITSFSPASGNVGTLVTLTGTRLDLVTAVAVNGTSSVILDQTSTALRLLVMPGATTGPLTTTGGAPATAAAAFTVTRTALGTAQQGPKLVGTGASSYVDQGQSVALSADGNTLAVGGTLDNSNTGATWVFTRSGTGWSQQGPKLVGTGALGSADQGTSVALSADGSTLAVGGSRDLRTEGGSWFLRTGATWVFSTASSPLQPSAPRPGPVPRPASFPTPSPSNSLSLAGPVPARGACSTAPAARGLPARTTPASPWTFPPFRRASTGYRWTRPRLGPSSSASRGKAAHALEGASVGNATGE